MTIHVEPIREVREHLAAIVDLAVSDQSTVITRRGREVAAIVPVALLHQAQEAEERRINAIISERMASDEPGTPLAEVMRETLARDD
jgi:prevent-host-death family protein